MKLKNIFLIFFFVINLSGCASTSLSSYVGQPMSQAVVAYGEPVNWVDIDAQTRAFIWQQSSTYTSPQTSNTTNNSHNGMWSSTTTYSAAKTTIQTCQYVLYAQSLHNNLPGPAGWLITGYKTPSVWCQ